MLTMVALLLVQVAVSAYACPMSASSPDLVAARAQTGMAGPCGSMSGEIDTEHPGLCLQHAQYGFQSAGHAEAPAVIPVALASTRVVVPEGLAAASRPKPRTEDRRWSEPAALSILHCCFRF